MVITCKECGFICKSQLVIAESAWSECYQQLMEHVATKHREKVEMVAKHIHTISLILVSQISLIQFANLPEDNEFVDTYMQTMEEQIMDAIGVVPDDENDDIEDDIEGAENESNPLSLTEEPVKGVTE